MFQRQTSRMVIIFWVLHPRNNGTVDHCNAACFPIAFTAAAVKQCPFTTAKFQHIARSTYTLVDIERIKELRPGKRQGPNLFHNDNQWLDYTNIRSSKARQPITILYYTLAAHDAWSTFECHYTIKVPIVSLKPGWYEPGGMEEFHRLVPFSICSGFTVYCNITWQHMTINHSL